MEVTTATLDDMARDAWWAHLDAGMIAVPDARRLPAAAKEGLLGFLRRGGKLVCAGAPLMGEALFRVGSAWLTPADLAAKRRAVEPRGSLLGAESDEEARWQHSSNNPRAPSRLSVEPTDRGAVLRLEIKDLQGWDNFAWRFAAPAFRDSETLTCFWVRSRRPADFLSVEWQEQDGSRWIATVPLKRAWQHSVLLPRDFVYWPDNPMGARRGGAGDHFHPERAARLTLGFAFSHRASAGDHTAWIADLGAAPDPFGGIDTGFEPPHLEAFSPAYQLYPLRTAVRWSLEPLPHPGARIHLPADAQSPLPRPSGIGLAERASRFVPRIWTVDAAGHERGALAWALLHWGDPYPGAAWLVIGTADEPFWLAHRAALSQLVTQAAAGLANGVFLAAAGTDRFTAYPREPFNVGARIANLGDREASVRVSVRIVRGARPGTAAPRFHQEQILRLSPRQVEAVRWPVPPLSPGPYAVRVDLRGAGPTDSLSHGLVVTERPHGSEAEGITVRGGHFRLHGRRWFALGVNFWPRYWVGTDREENQQHWLDPALYDPVLVQQDLDRVRAMGMNCVSVQYTQPEQALPLRDFLRRCHEEGLRVNLYLAGAHPLHFDPPFVRRLMEAVDLRNQPALFAYDVAWEPVWGGQDERRRFDADWRAWLIQRYGRIDRAEAAWRQEGSGAAEANRDPQGQVTGPTDEQVTRDGPWRKMVADYRRFQDDELNARYAQVRQLIRSIDPHRLIGARTGWGGGPFINNPAMPFDHASGAAQLDFISPEGWNLSGQEGADSFERGAFIPAYDRMVSGGKPVFWAEFGENCGYPLGGITGAGDEAGARRRLQQQAEYYDHFYRLAKLSDSDGAMAWWLPGGYRVDERSDYGMLNPDGTLRPAGAVAERYAPVLAHLTPAPRPETWLRVDRYADARGPWARWQKYAGELARLLRQGRRAGLKPVWSAHS